MHSRRSTHLLLLMGRVCRSRQQHKGDGYGGQLLHGQKEEQVLMSLLLLLLLLWLLLLLLLLLLLMSSTENSRQSQIGGSGSQLGCSGVAAKE